MIARQTSVEPARTYTRKIIRQRATFHAAPPDTREVAIKCSEITDGLNTVAAVRYYLAGGKETRGRSLRLR